MNEIMQFLQGSNDFEQQLSLNSNIVKQQLNKLSTIVTKYENTVNMLMQTMSLIHGNNAITIYSILDNLSVSLRSEKETLSKRVSSNTRFVPFIYKYPCQDGIIARLFEISNHLHNLYYFANNIQNCPELLDNIMAIFQKFEISLDDLQATIQKFNINKLQEDSMLRSVLYSESDDQTEDNNTTEE